jgi:hypothetical protein
VTVAPHHTTSSPAIEIEDGVIEEARRRQRRRRVAGVVLGGTACLIGVFVALLIGGGGGDNAGTPGQPPPGSPLKLTLVHGRVFVGGQPALVGLTPSLEAGDVGVCVRIANQGGCGPLPSSASPVYGRQGGFHPEEKVGPEGEIDAIFTGPGVAAMRVAHLGTFKAESAPGLPRGVKQIIFYRPPGSRGSVLPPEVRPQVLQGFEHARQGPALTETLLDASGRTIPVGRPPTFRLPNSYWQRPQASPVQGRCAVSSSLAGTHIAWGMVATKIAADPNLTTPGWLSCLDVWFSAPRTSYEAAILLNAQSPGSPPAPLWGAIPMPGHPGVVEVPPVQRAVHLPPLSAAEAARILAVDTKIVGQVRAEQILRASERRTFWEVFVPPTVARRVGFAWLLVRYGNSLAQRVAFLEALRITKLGAPRESVQSLNRRDRRVVQIPSS